MQLTIKNTQSVLVNPKFVPASSSRFGKSTFCKGIVIADIPPLFQSSSYVPPPPPLSTPILYCPALHAT